MNPRNEDVEATAKIVICGDSEVGKSCILHRFHDNEFSTTYKKTVGVDFVNHVWTVNGHRIRLQIWDTGGEQKFRSVRTSFFRGAVGAILVFDITNRQSFLRIPEWVNEIRELASPNLPILLVGAKLDLATERGEGKGVSYGEARDLAAQYGFQYVECSAATGAGITKVFDTIATLTMQIRQSRELERISDAKMLEENIQRIHQNLDSLESLSDISQSFTPKIDNVFGDLENTFNGLGKFLYEFTCQAHFGSFSFLQKTVMLVPRLIVQLIMYIIFFILLMLVLLPSFFWLLLLRTRTVEIDNTQFGIRQQVLQAETKARKFLRVLNVLFRSVPMTFILGCWPIVVVASLIPTLATDSHPDRTGSVVLWTIGSHLCIVLLLQLLGTIRNGKSLQVREEAKIVEYQDKPFRWKNLGNWIAVITLTVDFVQMCVWPLQRLQPEDGAPPRKFIEMSEDDGSNSSGAFLDFIVQDLIPALFLRLSSHLYEITFFIGFGCVCLLLLVFTFQFMSDILQFTAFKQQGKQQEANDFFFNSFSGAMVYGHGLLKNVSTKITGIVSFLSDAMFMTVCSQLLSMLSCSYSPDFSDYETGALIANPQVQCWTGDHRVKAVLALIAFSYYVPLCVMVAPMLMTTDPEKKDVRFVETYLMTLTLTKCVLLVFSTFFSHSNLLMVIATMIISLALLICTFFWSIRQPNRLLKPASQPFANILKCATYSTAVWTSIVALAFYGAGNDGYMNQSSQWIAIGVGILVNILVGSGWYLSFKLSERKNFAALKEESVELQVVPPAQS